MPPTSTDPCATSVRISVACPAAAPPVGTTAKVTPSADVRSAPIRSTRKWPATPPASPSTDQLGAMEQRRITDALECPAPGDVLAGLGEGYRPGDTDLAWAHMALSYAYAWGRFSDQAKATEHVDKFFALCGTVLDSYPLRTLVSDGSPAVQKHVAKSLRSRLTA